VTTKEIPDHSTEYWEFQKFLNSFRRQPEVMALAMAMIHNHQHRHCHNHPPAANLTLHTQPLRAVMHQTMSSSRTLAAPMTEPDARPSCRTNMETMTDSAAIPSGMKPWQ
jgi:hypothetical protein